MKLAIATAPSRRVSLTPLIDVVFILLVFFMLETTFRAEGGVQIAEAQPGSAAGGEQLLVVEVFDEAFVWVDGERFPAAAWSTELGRVDQPVEVRTAPAVTIQRIVAILDALQEHGAVGVSLGKVQGFGP